MSNLEYLHYNNYNIYNLSNISYLTNIKEINYYSYYNYYNCLFKEPYEHDFCLQYFFNKITTQFGELQLNNNMKKYVDSSKYFKTLKYLYDNYYYVKHYNINDIEHLSHMYTCIFAYKIYNINKLVNFNNLNILTIETDINTTLEFLENKNHLIHLELHGKFKGDLRYISKLPKLRKLILLNYNGSLKRIRNLKNLKYLHLDNFNSDLHTHLNKLNNLIYLNLGNKFNQQLKNISLLNLQEIIIPDIFNNYIYNLNMPNLLELHLGVLFNKEITFLGRFEKLEFLNFSFKFNSYINYLGHFPSLKKIYTYTFNSKFKSLGYTPKLRTLSLQYLNQIFDIRYLTKLTYLRVKYTLRNYIIGDIFTFEKGQKITYKDYDNNILYYCYNIFTEAKYDEYEEYIEKYIKTYNKLFNTNYNRFNFIYYNHIDYYNYYNCYDDYIDDRDYY
jgi:hypothetical protein